jgi:hypothetical protein
MTRSTRSALALTAANRSSGLPSPRLPVRAENEALWEAAADAERARDGDKPLAPVPELDLVPRDLLLAREVRRRRLAA